MDEQHKQALESARNSLERMQKFDPDSIARVDKLGPQINFADSVSAAKRLTGIYNRLSLDALDELSVGQLTQIRDCADRDFSHLDQIEKFDLKQGNPVQHRDALAQQLEGAYAPSFEQLLLFICHGVSRTADFKALEMDARSANQRMQDEFAQLRKGMEDKDKEADSMLVKIRSAAAEQGVSQQAVYFKEEANKHAANAADWLKRVWWAAGILVVYAVASLFLPALSWLQDMDTVQLAVSKTLIFIVLGYALFFCAKNHAADRHNAVVNRHRQNALMTYQTLVKANKNPENADIVLTHAARFIYAPQDSGYARSGAADSGGISIESFRRVVDRKGDE